MYRGVRRPSGGLKQSWFSNGNFVRGDFDGRGFNSLYVLAPAMRGDDVVGLDEKADG
jgi:hypothetical protein